MSVVSLRSISMLEVEFLWGHTKQLLNNCSFCRSRGLDGHSEASKTLRMAGLFENSSRFKGAKFCDLLFGLGRSKIQLFNDCFCLLEDPTPGKLSRRAGSKCTKHVALALNTTTVVGTPHHLFVASRRWLSKWALSNRSTIGNTPTRATCQKSGTE